MSNNPLSLNLTIILEKLNYGFYDPQLCFTICIQFKLFNKIGCIDITTENIFDAPFCRNTTEMELLASFTEHQKVSSITDCEAACPSKCNFIECDLSLSMVPFPTQSYLKIFNNSGFLRRFSEKQEKPLSESELINYGRIGLLKFVVI